MKTRYALVMLSVCTVSLSDVYAQGVEAPTPRPSLWGRVLGRQAEAPAPVATVAPTAAPTRRPAVATTPKPEARKTATPKPTTPKPEATTKPEETPKSEATPKATTAVKTEPAPNTAADDAKRIDEKAQSAIAAAVEFLGLANKGYYAQAMTKLIPAQQDYFNGAVSVANGVSFKSVLDQVTRDGNVQRWNVTANVRGEGCRITADIIFKDGKSSRKNFEMMMINNSWRMILPDANVPTEEGDVPSPVANAVEDVVPVETPAVAAAPTVPANVSPADVIQSLTNDAVTTGGAVPPTADAPWRR